MPSATVEDAAGLEHPHRHRGARARQPGDHHDRPPHRIRRLHAEHDRCIIAPSRRGRYRGLATAAAGPLYYIAAGRPGDAESRAGMSERVFQPTREKPRSPSDLARSSGWPCCPCALAAPAEAYIGPGAGFALVGSFLVLLTTWSWRRSSILAWPFRTLWRLLRRRTAGRAAGPAPHRRRLRRPGPAPHRALDGRGQAAQLQAR